MTILDGEYSSYTCECASTEVAIWVKFQGSTDETQKLCYKGNCVEFECAYVIPTSFNIDGVEHTNVIIDKIKDTIESGDYEIVILGCVIISANSIPFVSTDPILGILPNNVSAAKLNSFSLQQWPCCHHLLFLALY